YHRTRRERDRGIRGLTRPSASGWRRGRGSAAPGADVRRSGLRRDHADCLRLVDAQHDALADIELVVHPVLAAVAGLEVLAEDQDADPGVDQDAAGDRRLEDAGGAQPPEML